MPRENDRRVTRRKQQPKRAPIFQYRLGAEIEGSVSERLQWLIPDRLYQLHIKWRDVERIPGVYTWPEYYHQNFMALANHAVIASVRVVPEWARLWPDEVGSPPAEKYYPALAMFIVELINRYPWIVGVALFKEPDVPGPTDTGEYFGSWVHDNNFIEGGRLYGQMTNAVYSWVKQIHPKVKILAGELIGEETSFPFIRSAIASGLKADAISFHRYGHMGGGDVFTPFSFAKRLRKLTKLPLALTEAAFLSRQDSLYFRQLQGKFLGQLLDNFDELDVDLLLWYTLANHGWENSDLVWNSVAQPAYEVWKRGISEKKKQPKARVIRDRRDR